MNTWFVGNVPIGHHKYNYPSPVAPDPKLPHEKQEPVPILGREIFFMKARILAGQVDLTNNKHGFNDFAWVTKEELKKVVGKEYYISNMNMLASR
jgi:large subunit ribosomal protein L46